VCACVCVCVCVYSVHLVSSVSPSVGYLELLKAQKGSHSFPNTTATLLFQVKVQLLLTAIIPQTFVLFLL